MVFAALKRRIDEQDGSLSGEVDLWLTLVALIACVEGVCVCALATWRYSRKIYHVKLQRWTIRILLVGPVFSSLMWISLWSPSIECYLTIPVGFYQSYAFYCYYAMLVCFIDGEERLTVALSALPGPPRAFVYHPFGRRCSCGEFTPFLGTRLSYSAVREFKTSARLLTFLRRCVCQAMVVKPLTVVLMILLERSGHAQLRVYPRFFSLASMYLLANALMQLYHVVLPRIRGFGGDTVFMLLLVMIIVLIVQDVVVTSLLLGDRTSSATVNEAARLVLILTILEFTAFSNIFCRLLPPERFAQLSRSTSSGNVAALKFGNCGPVRLPLLSFALETHRRSLEY